MSSEQRCETYCPCKAELLECKAQLDARNREKVQMEKRIAELEEDLLHRDTSMKREQDLRDKDNNRWFNALTHMNSDPQLPNSPHDVLQRQRLTNAVLTRRLHLTDDNETINIEPSSSSASSSSSSNAARRAATGRNRFHTFRSPIRRTRSRSRPRARYHSATRTTPSQRGEGPAGHRGY